MSWSSHKRIWPTGRQIGTVISETSPTWQMCLIVTPTRGALRVSMYEHCSTSLGIHCPFQFSPTVTRHSPPVLLLVAVTALSGRKSHLSSHCHKCLNVHLFQTLFLVAVLTSDTNLPPSSLFTYLIIMLRRSSASVASQRMSDLRATANYNTSRDHRIPTSVNTVSISSPLATIQDVTEDWSYFENSYVLTQPYLSRMSEDGTASDGSCDVHSLYGRGWNTSDYDTSDNQSDNHWEEAPSSTSNYSSGGSHDDERSLIDMDAMSFDNDATIIALPSPIDDVTQTASAFEPLTPSRPGHQQVGLFDIALQEREIYSQHATINTLETSLTRDLQLLHDSYSLIEMQSNLMTPIHGPISRLRFAEENLPPYDAAAVTAKLDELHRLAAVIREGGSQYDELRDLLSSGTWSEEQGLRYWDRTHKTISCNKERSDADFLIWTIPFQIPIPPPLLGNINLTKRRGRRHRESMAAASAAITAESNVSEAHRNANHAAKQWRGHIGIRRDHLEMHIRVFGLKELPELPTEVMKGIGEEDAASIMASLPYTPRESFADESDLRSMRSVSTRGDMASEANGVELGIRDSMLPVQMRGMVKSQSRKAMQVLGIKPTDNMLEFQ
ncbi:hypothetical protein EJ05DRAFT_5562 [Pseudovirgaria hyperparasitica]|uniref:Uncharacterized protein n=1 Tax=Pseudovirgaria hyperparasitica TaxID=470096 RepID=A0A6A6WJS8_9PEZI|nr:uncharacterized protein EJ05DRAFT_5562 [Pseudovirgaria hyperparasitica]KAF2762546.1 hypothetical protein EJ05DRAFT_5562 [Pseudovirgaria hyperparasitica]